MSDESTRRVSHVHVVVAGPSYGHGPPQAAFDNRRDAEKYAEGCDGDWTDIESVPFNPEEENDD